MCGLWEGQNAESFFLRQRGIYFSQEKKKNYVKTPSGESGRNPARNTCDLCKKTPFGNFLPQKAGRKESFKLQTFRTGKDVYYILYIGLDKNTISSIIAPARESQRFHVPRRKAHEDYQAQRRGSRF